MAYTLCDARERSEATGFHLIPATPEIGEHLIGILTDHRVIFERVAQPEAKAEAATGAPAEAIKSARQSLIAIVGPQNHGRIVALLRHLLSEPERRAVSVFAGDGSEFPTPRLLDEWWRVYETEWFAQALRKDRFVTWFQPLMDTACHSVIGHECLIRLSWGRDFTGAEILDAARARQEIHIFDAYARNLAIRSAARQTKDGVYFINFLPSSISNPRLCLQTTLQTLRDSGLHPRNIVFEVVESELTGDRAHLHRVCDFFRSHDFGLALDGPGKGPESLQLLRDLRPNFIKLDKNLVRDVEHPVYASFIRKVVDISDRFGVTVVAKGVERTRVMENLWLLGVQCMQGYLFGRPGPRLTVFQKAPSENVGSQNQAMTAVSVH
jgi:EAL domain-containing protein (putative c-di-GMP-specific phosphodiesterase class I)